MNVHDVLEAVVRPALAALGPTMRGEAAERLLLGTGAHESDGFRYLRQVRGPALGIFQMEPRTHEDIWRNFLPGRPALNTGVRQLLSVANTNARIPDAGELAWNLRYAAAMCRIHYARVPSRLPGAQDIAGMATYWKAHYNTPAGKGTTDQFLDAYRRHVLPVIGL